MNQMMLFELTLIVASILQNKHKHIVLQRMNTHSPLSVACSIADGAANKEKTH